MRQLALLLCIALPVVARAQSPDTSRQPPFAAVRGAFFALSVADLDASTRWYEETLGLRVVARFPPRQGSAVTVLEGGGLTVELLQLDAAAPRVDASASQRGAQFTHGIFKVGFFVDDFDATIARLRARGIAFAFGPFPAREGQPANAAFRDNAGNFIQVFGR